MDELHQTKADEDQNILIIQQRTRTDEYINMCTRKAQKYIIECACMAQNQLQISRFYVKVLEGQIKNIGLYTIYRYIILCYIFLLFTY
jgi:hypothetical protein